MDHVTIIFQMYPGRKILVNLHFEALGITFSFQFILSFFMGKKPRLVAKSKWIVSHKTRVTQPLATGAGYGHHQKPQRPVGAHRVWTLSKVRDKHSAVTQLNRFPNKQTMWILSTRWADGWPPKANTGDSGSRNQPLRSQKWSCLWLMESNPFPAAGWVHARAWGTGKG